MPAQSRYRRSPDARRPSTPSLTLALQSGAYGGRNVAREQAAEGTGGRVVFVQGGIPGETVRADLTLAKKSYAEARATAILAPSAARTMPPCVYFGENGYRRGSVPAGSETPAERGACGGCQHQHMSYEAQLALKRDIVAQLMRRQGGLTDLEVLPTLPSPSPWQYRNRARWVVDEEGGICYHQAASERLIAVDHCHIVQPLLQQVLSALSASQWRLPLRTLVSEITARTAHPFAPVSADRETVAMLALHPREGARRFDLRLLASDLGAALPNLDGVVLVRNMPSAEHAASASSLWGAAYFDARFAGYRYRLAPLTFFQVNDGAAELLVEQVLGLLGPLAGHSVLDLYAGAGTFSVPIAARAQQVLAVESDPAAIDDAEQTARTNGLTNLHIAPGQVEAELPGLPLHAADAAVLDPPRAGLSPAVIDELARIDIPRITYVSCDPATLARDLRRFTERGYRVETIQPIDLFPQTYHVEIVVALSRD